MNEPEEPVQRKHNQKMILIVMEKISESIYYGQNSTHGENLI